MQRINWNKSKDNRVTSKEGRFIILPIHKYRGPVIDYQIHDNLTDKFASHMLTQKNCKEWAEDVIKEEESKGYT